MTLKDSLYTLLSSESAPDGSAFRCNLRLHADHPIYRAHFPGEPVTPGVCIVQMAQELLTIHLGQQLTLRAAKNVKFLSVISPVVTPDITFLLEKIQQSADDVTAQATVLAGDSVLTKISFTCSKA